MEEQYYHSHQHHRFDNDKENHLRKLLHHDKSRKGTIDEPIATLIATINKKHDFFTTSSCSGRIRILQAKPNAKKNEHRWIFQTHEPLSEEQKNALYGMLANPQTLGDETWLIMEGAIIHLCARSLAHAQQIIKAAKEVGFKRSGLQAFERRCMVELLNNDRIETIIAKENALLVSEKYFSVLIDIANRKLKRNHLKIAKLEKKILDTFPDTTSKHT